MLFFTPFLWQEGVSQRPPFFGIIMAYNKYNNKKTVVDGIKFDSKAESQRYLELKAREQKGLIQNLRLQESFVLIPSQREPDTVSSSGKKEKGKVIHRAITYVADFVYIEDGEEVVEDCKGFRTSVYEIKRKLFYYRYGKNIIETSEKVKMEREKDREMWKKLREDAKTRQKDLTK